MRATNFFVSLLFLGCSLGGMAFADTTGLEHTDGYGLLPQAARFSKEESEAIFQAGKQACQSDCVSPFAEKLGENNHVAAYSNCKSSCITPEYTFMDVATKAMSVHTQDPQKAGLHYVGVTYQCVEYARRWWMSNEGITFGDVDGAADIIYLTEVEAIASDKKYPMGRSINGTAQRPPAKGDLVIYYPNRKDPKWRFGHVAVVVNVDLDKGEVALAEENYNNKPWPASADYSRKIQLFNISGRYRLLDVETLQNKNIEGGLIAGWVYPLLNK